LARSILRSEASPKTPFRSRFRAVGRVAKSVSFGEDDGGRDTVYAGASGDNVSGELGPDLLIGGDGYDLILGGAGDDWPSGFNNCSDCQLKGEIGNDSIYGEAGIDVLRGGDGADHLDGGPDGDQCWGGDGADTFSSCHIED
jgi:Ca2+-binding RTX toxin-like protein